MPRIQGTTDQALAVLQAKIDADPQIQQLLTSQAARIRATHDQGGDARKFQNGLRDQITQIAKQKGYLPTTDQVFINPNNGRLEGHGGWSGLNTATKVAIVAAAAAATGGAALYAGGAFGAAAGAGSAAAGGGTTAGTIGGLGAGLGVTSGVPAGLAAASATGVGAGGASLGASPWIAALTNAGKGVAQSKLQGGSWRDALISGGTGAATGGLAGGGGSGMNWTDLLTKVATNPETYAALGQVAGKAGESRADQRNIDAVNTNAFNNSDINRYQAEQAAQNQAGQLDLQRQTFSENARGGRARQATIADLLSNLQDVNISVPGIQNANIQGGLRASTLGAGGRASLAELHKQALAAQLAGDTFTGGEVLTPPGMAPMPKKGGTESALDWIGLLGSVAGGVGKGMQQKPVVDPDEPLTYSQLPRGSIASSTGPLGRRGI